MNPFTYLKITSALWIGLIAHAEAINLVITDSGSAPADIQLSVDAFRSVLGPANAPTPGSLPDGRREVNWDGAPDSVSAPNAFPGDFFNGNASPLARGLSLSTPGTGFQLSATTASGTATRFGNLDPAFSVNFAAFTEERLFSPLGSVITEVRFFGPGTGIPALTDGFGAVFTGVETADSSRIDFYDIDDQLIVSEFVPESGPGGLSFLGVAFDRTRLARLEIVSGEAALDAAGMGDRVALDDFIFGEPQAIPEPSVSLLVLLAGLFVAVRRRSARCPPH